MVELFVIPVTRKLLLMVDGHLRSLVKLVPFFLLTSLCSAEPTKTLYNPFTGKLDYITRIDSNTIIGGVNCTVTSNAGGTVTITCPAGGSGASALGIGTGTASGFSGVITSSPTGTFL